MKNELKKVEFVFVREIKNKLKMHFEITLLTFQTFAEKYS